MSDFTSEGLGEALIIEDTKGDPVKFLIVDDIDDNRILLRQTLESRGFTVQEAGNGIQALDLARVEPPDIIISEVLMPEMDGFTLCRVLKGIEHLKQIPFIFYTSTCLDKEDEKLGMTLGASRYLLKPVDLSDFLLSIDEIISEHAKGILPATGSTINTELNFEAPHQAHIAQKRDEKIRDVSGQLPDEEKIRILSQAVEQSPLSVMITDTNVNIEYVNQAFEQITGYTSNDVIGKTPRLETCAVILLAY